jgi:tetraacyldisaccharide 4'-kinase
MPAAQNGFEDRLIRHWFSPTPLLPWPIRGLLWTVSRVFRLVSMSLRVLGQAVRPPQSVPGVRVIAVGNLVVGGAGKTPCVMALALGLRQAGLRCGLVTRGYRSKAEHRASRVVGPNDLPTTPASDIGDEAWLMCWRTQLPVAVGKNRLQGVRALKHRYPEIDVVLLDDGLQQKSLRADQQLLVLDERGFGNGQCLPAGPLREPIGDLQRFDAWIDNGFSTAPPPRDFAGRLPECGGRLQQSNTAWVPLASWSSPEHWLPINQGVEKFSGKRLLAVAGIAVPARFFKTLRDLGLAFEEFPLHDHDPQTTALVRQKWATRLYDAVLMTEKDAVKFFNSDIGTMNAWALRRDARFNDDFLTRFLHGRQTP